VNYSDPPTSSSDTVLAFDMDNGRMLWSLQLLPADVFNFGCTTEKHENCPARPGQDAVSARLRFFERWMQGGAC
jgi:hypothetical protein